MPTPTLTTFRLIAFSALLGFGLVHSAAAKGTSSAYPSIRLAQGGELVMRLSGEAYRDIDQVRVVNGERSSKERRDLYLTLGSWRNGSRNLTLAADKAAKVGYFNRIEGLVKGKPSLLLPLQLEVAGGKLGSSWFLQRPQGRDKPFADRSQYPALTALHQFSQPITEISAAQRELYPNAVPIDSQLLNCQSFDLYVLCPNADTVGGYTGAEATPVYSFQPQSPAIVGSTFELNSFDLLAYVGDQISVTLAGLDLDVLQVSDSKVIASLPDFPVQGELRITRLSDGASAVLDEDYAVIEPEELPFDTFNAETSDHSLHTAYLMSVVSQHVYRDIENEPDGTNIYCDERPVVFEQWGLNTVDCLNEDGINLNTGWFTDTQALVLENQDALIIGFAGTQQYGWNRLDLASDLYAIPMFIGPAWANGLHSGFYAAHNPELPDGRRLYSAIYQHAANAHKAGKKIWVTGHSLGGALAQITAYRLQAVSGIEVQGVVTFGSPRIGSPDFADAFDAEFGNRAQRWVNYLDPIPTLPPEPIYRHGGNLVNIDENGAIEPEATSEMTYPFDTDALTEEHMDYFGIIYDAFTASPESGDMAWPQPLEY